MIKIKEYESRFFDVAVAAFSQLSLYYLKENASDKRVVAANLRKNILGSGSSMKVLLAYHDESICGLASYTIMYPATKETGQLFLKELFVFPEFTRQGIGLALMVYLAKIAVNNNCSRFDWTANDDSKAAAGFYKKMKATLLHRKKYYRLSAENLTDMADRLN